MLKGINIYFCSGILNINLTQYVVFKKEHFFVVCPDQRGSIAKELAPIGIYLFYVPPCSVYNIFTRIHAAYFILEFFISETKLNVCFLQLLDLQ